MIQGMTGLGSADPQQLGPYRLYGVLGHGRMGTVYLGRGAPQRGARKQLVAVRTLRPELIRDRPLRARLRQEMQSAATGVSSRYVADAAGCELDGAQPWIANSYVPGLSLEVLVARYGPLPESSVRALGGALARSLVALHAARISHRDLGPHNVMIAADAPRAVDYGLALGRMSGPATDEMADDVFDLGAALVFASSAHQPFAGNMLPMAREDPDLTGVPDGLCPALFACLHKTPESRPSPGVLAHALDLADTAAEPAVDWLPEVFAHDIEEAAQAARKLTGRRLFGR
ncbi:protein kinase domain-containing protein [Streptomyces nanshensis]|uniref:protein kinase domain-containing protein n=1 Tax=Streptomyces nanshensis TaxID=518642 RepID=UPI00114CFF4A|nr:protein kinase [Streptomyces nanshensis]